MNRSVNEHERTKRFSRTAAPSASGPVSTACPGRCSAPDVLRDPSPSLSHSVPLDLHFACVMAGMPYTCDMLQTNDIALHGIPIIKDSAPLLRLPCCLFVDLPISLSLSLSLPSPIISVSTAPYLCILNAVVRFVV